MAAVLFSPLFILFFLLLRADPRGGNRGRCSAVIGGSGVIQPRRRLLKPVRPVIYMQMREPEPRVSSRGSVPANGSGAHDDTAGNGGAGGTGPLRADAGTIKTAPALPRFARSPARSRGCPVAQHPQERSTFCGETRAESRSRSKEKEERRERGSFCRQRRCFYLFLFFFRVAPSRPPNSARLIAGIEVAEIENYAGTMGNASRYPPPSSFHEFFANSLGSLGAQRSDRLFISRSWRLTSRRSAARAELYESV